MCIDVDMAIWNVWHITTPKAVLLFYPGLVFQEHYRSYAPIKLKAERLAKRGTKENIESLLDGYILGIVNFTQAGCIKT